MTSKAGKKQRSTARIKTGNLLSTIFMGVTAAYNPQRPNEAHIQSNSSIMIMWPVPMITGGLGGAFLLVSLLVRWIN